MNYEYYISIDEYTVCYSHNLNLSHEMVLRYCSLGVLTNWSNYNVINGYIAGVTLSNNAAN